MYICRFDENRIILQINYKSTPVISRRVFICNVLPNRYGGFARSPTNCLLFHHLAKTTRRRKTCRPTNPQDKHVACRCEFAELMQMTCLPAQSK